MKITRRDEGISLFVQGKPIGALCFGGFPEIVVDFFSHVVCQTSAEFVAADTAKVVVSKQITTHNSFRLFIGCCQWTLVGLAITSWTFPASCYAPSS